MLAADYDGPQKASRPKGTAAPIKRRAPAGRWASGSTHRIDHAIRLVNANREPEGRRRSRIVIGRRRVVVGRWRRVVITRRGEVEAATRSVIAPVAIVVTVVIAPVVRLRRTERRHAGRNADAQRKRSGCNTGHEPISSSHDSPPLSCAAASPFWGWSCAAFTHKNQQIARIVPSISLALKAFAGSKYGRIMEPIGEAAIELAARISI